MEDHAHRKRASVESYARLSLLITTEEREDSMTNGIKGSVPMGWVAIVAFAVAAPVFGAGDITYVNQGAPQRLIEVPDRYAVGVAGDAEALKAWVSSESLQLRKTSSLGITGAKLAGPGVAVVRAAPVGKGSAAKAKVAMTGLAKMAGVTFVYPVYRYPGSKQLVFPQPELIVCVRAGSDIHEIAGRYGLKVLRGLAYTTDQFVLAIQPGQDPFVVSDALWKDPGVLWSNPNLMKQLEKRYQPNDPLYPQQWHLHNTGQGGGTAGADVGAEAAWDLHIPRSDVVIAIVDDAVEIDHPDFNIWTNPAEAQGTMGVDDDGNGYVDDLHGWDFGGNDNDPSPDVRAGTDELEAEAHGTSVAGVAAAKGNNGIGVVGAAFNCAVLPVKLGLNGEFTDDEESFANAIRYAAVHADVMNNSWGSPEVSDSENAALDFATSSPQVKRGALGVPVLFASGNDATMFLPYEGYDPIGAGNHTITVVYEKDGSGSAGEDKVWIEEIALLQYDADDYVVDVIDVRPLDTTFPAGVSGGGDVPFRAAASTIAETGFVFESAPIGNFQSSELVWQVNVPSGGDWYFAMKYRVSTQASTDPNADEPDGDLLFALVDNAPIEGVAYLGDEEFSEPFSGITPDNLAPLQGHNLHPGVINIGASTDGDVRSSYSQWGPRMDFVAPSDGGVVGILTTDISGLGNGYDPDSNYTEGDPFGGTSSACPLASGVFAMMISANPDLSVDQIREILRETSAKIGPLPYDQNGFNEQYGYGRLDMAAAVERALESVVDVPDWQVY